MTTHHNALRSPRYNPTASSPISRYSPVRGRCCAVLATAAWLFFVWCGARQAVGQSLAQRVDQFEGGRPRWILVESDCQAQLVEHEISLLQPRSGRTSELFQVACGTGQQVLLAYPIEPCLPLNEFQPRLWTRCSSGGIRLGVRIVFPLAEHPITRGRLQTIVWGDTYKNAGEWQMLQVAELEKLAQAAVISLRNEWGAAINLEGAYIDSLVLNAYTGPGRYRVQVDDLDLRGMVPLAALGRPLEANWRETWRWRTARPAHGAQLWSAANRPPVWLQYHDEPLPWLRSLGFTGLFLERLPDEQQLARIAQSELGIVAPPPAYNLTLDESSKRAIKGWLVGAALDRRQVDIVRTQTQQVQNLANELRRPLVGEALEQYWMFSRMADEVIVPAPGPSLPGSSLEKLQWLERQLAVTRQRGRGWVSINTGETPALVEQYQAALEALGEPQPAGLPANPLGLRHQATSAILAGARGILFRSMRPLDIQAESDSAAVAAIRLINSDLETWGPWIMAGQANQPPQLSRSDFVVRAWGLDDSQMIIAMSATAEADRSPPPTYDQSLRFELAQGRLQQVLRLTHGQLSRVQAEIAPGGSSFTISRPEPIEVILITDNPRMLDFVRGKLSANESQRSADHLEITQYSLRIAEQIIAARFTAEAATPQLAADLRRENRRLAVLNRQLESAWQALRQNRANAALTLSLETSQGVQQVMREALSAASSSLASPQSSPFVLSPALLPLHWQVANACSRSTWERQPLPGGELSDLDELLRTGWSQQRRLEEQVDLRVEVLPSNEATRPGGLRLAAYQRQTQPGLEPLSGGYQGASLRVRSAAIPVRKGQLLRITAVARVLKAGQDTDSGLLVYDNFAGPSLGQLVRATPGGQTPVELYRFATEDGELRILAECRGECDVVLESLIVDAITPATNRSSFPMSPLGALPGEMTLHLFDSPDSP
jgi:hypothetical protein